MTTQSPVVSVPLTLDQLLLAVRQLDDAARVQVAKVLLEKDMDEKLMALIQRLAERQPPAEVSEALINEEVRLVRQTRAQGGNAQNRC